MSLDFIDACGGGSYINFSHDPLPAAVAAAGRGSSIPKQFGTHRRGTFAAA